MFNKKYVYVPIYDNDLSYGGGIIGYVSVPCYLIDEKNMIEVVIGVDINNLNLFIEPVFDENSDCLNSVFVTNYYDSYEESINATNRVNSILFTHVETRLARVNNRHRIFEVIGIIESLQDAVNYVESVNVNVK